MLRAKVRDKALKILLVIEPCFRKGLRLSIESRVSKDAIKKQERVGLNRELLGCLLKQEKDHMREERNRHDEGGWTPRQTTSN